MTEVLAFGRWSTKDVQVADPGLKRYIHTEARLVPKTGARYAGNKFHKSKIFIVERLINKIMIPGHKAKKHFKSSGHSTGKSITAIMAVERVFERIEQRTKKNPVEVFITAIENAAPREEVIAIEYGGARYPKAVECSPQRRIDLVLRYMVQGSYQKSFNSKKSFVNCLADEIMHAYETKMESVAIAKKNETERQADASR